jgi:hypothetical protein
MFVLCLCCENNEIELLQIFYVYELLQIFYVYELLQIFYVYVIKCMDTRSTSTYQEITGWQAVILL